MSRDLEAFIAGASVAADVFELRPDYRVLLIAVDGIDPSLSEQHDDAVDAMVAAAEESARNAGVPEEVPHLASWREAFRSFGAKPQRTRNGAEALLRRAAGAGLPRVNRLTDAYNAISVLHRIPLGGEDLDGYQGSPKLIRATGSEDFDTVADGEPIVEHPDAGEVVWCDDAGVTCRRWNWRQGYRTRLRDETTAAVFILDALDPLDDDELNAAGDELIAQLKQLGATHVVRRLIGNEGR